MGVCFPSGFNHALVCLSQPSLNLRLGWGVLSSHLFFDPFAAATAWPVQKTRPWLCKREPLQPQLPAWSGHLYSSASAEMRSQSQLFGSGTGRSFKSSFPTMSLGSHNI